MHADLKITSQSRDDCTLALEGGFMSLFLFLLLDTCDPLFQRLLARV
jgi:hypothetical protein